jgi:UDP-GlcNAc:undecaprenyl-phosphate/decaprenyl-phosphate GlcNAc-1-phosphate transferase
MNTLIIWGVAAFVLSFCLTVLIKRFAHVLGVLDQPVLKRKIHKRPIAQGGGVAIYIAVAAVILGLVFSGDLLTAGEISSNHYFGVLLGGLVLMVWGYIDDRWGLPPHAAILGPVIAAGLAIGFGIEVDKITNPFGGVIELSSGMSSILVFVWLMVVMYTTKFLDGLDGLATSITATGGLMIMLLALTAAYFQPDVALLSAISIGALLGFLFWNVHPASIFLGEGGSVFVGYLLGVLSVISGGKLAIALLVLGIPLFDAVWVVVRRFRVGGIKQIFIGDRKHLHHRLLDRGWSQHRIVAMYLFVALAFGSSALFLQSKEKLVALVLLTIMLMIGAYVIVKKDKTSS